jgi:hypothetical protein
MTREGFAGKHRPTVPAFRDGIACYLGDDDDCVNRLRRCGRGRGLFATFAIFGKGLAGEHDGFGCGAIEYRGLVVCGSLLNAIERGLGSEATRNSGRTLIAIASTAAAVSVSAVATVAVVASVTVAVVASATVSAITAAAILRNGCGIGIGDGSGCARDGRFGCSVDIVGVVLAVGRSVVRSELRRRLWAGGLSRLVALATATAAATTATPAAAAISTGSTFTEFGAIIGSHCSVF